MNNSINNSIGKRILEILKQCSISQTTLATMLGFSHSHISNIIHGKANPSERLLDDLCRKLNINLNWLKTGYGEKYKDINDSEIEHVVEMFNDLSDDSKQIILKILETFLKVDNLEKK